MRMRLITIGAGALTAGLVGCAVDTGGDPLAQTQQRANVFEDFERWPDVIPVCFVNGDECEGGVCGAESGVSCSSDGDCDVPNFDAASDEVMDILDETWGSVGVISFKDEGECGSDVDDMLVLHLENRGTANGNCGSGVGAHCYVAGASPVPATIVHEVGHALGFAHEHTRTDDPPVCTTLTDKIAACHACVDGDCDEDNLSACTCKAADFNYCVPGASATGTKTLTKADFDDVNHWLGEREPQDYTEAWTTYDANSVMNYCAVSYEDKRNQGYLTDLDELALEMLYHDAGERTGLGCKSGCWNASSGQLLHKSGSLTLEWIARGAIPWSQSAETSWIRDNAEISDERDLPASELSDGVQGLRVETLDRFGDNLTGQGIVRKDSARWTAVLGAML